MAHDTDDAIVIRDLSCSMGDHKLRVDNLSISCGTVTAVLGHSGSGKTTLLNLLGGFSSPDSGTIEVLGKDPRLLVGEKRIVRTVFQDLALFPNLNAKQHLKTGSRCLRLSRSIDDLYVSAWLEFLKLDHVATSRPNTMSGGEKQRLALGRALISSPRIVLLDEPMTAIDYSHRCELWDYIERLSRSYKRCTFVVITHDPIMAMNYADDAVVVVKGRVAQSGPIDGVFMDPDSPEVASLFGDFVFLETGGIPVCVRPDYIQLGINQNDVCMHTATVSDIRIVQESRIISLECTGGSFSTRYDGDNDFTVGDEIYWGRCQPVRR